MPWLLLVPAQVHKSPLAASMCQLMLSLHSPCCLHAAFSHCCFSSQHLYETLLWPGKRKATDPPRRYCCCLLGQGLHLAPNPFHSWFFVCIDEKVNLNGLNKAQGPPIHLPQPCFPSTRAGQVSGGCPFSAPALGAGGRWEQAEPHGSSQLSTYPMHTPPSRLWMGLINQIQHGLQNPI